MNRDEQGVKIHNNELPHWSVLLKEWIGLIKHYCNFMEDDAPYYHTERANIGILSGAAWKAGWISLEEFGARKRGKNQGRCDLYLYPIDQERGEYIEAKQVWSMEKAEPGLTRAVRDARDLRVYISEAAVRIGVVFICPSIHEKFTSRLDAQIEAFKETAATISCDAFAWSFPASARELRGDGQYKNIIYPGVLLLARVVG